jgi:tRNA(Ile)-lysidine synthetase-like protein
MRVTEEDCLDDKVLSALRQVVKFYSDKVLNVAFSGGLDSSVLLTGLAMLRDQHRCHLRALHVNHGWTEDAKVWESACARYAHTLGIEFRVTRLSRPSAKKLSTEAAARRQRLEWFAQVAGPGEPVLTAHHSDDQAETFLLRLMRGAGTRGLGGMQFEREFKGMLVLRPLLGLSRADLQTWAQTQGLSPIEDPANTDTRFDRNFARHEISRCWSRGGRAPGRRSIVRQRRFGRPRRCLMRSARPTCVPVITLSINAFWGSMVLLQFLSSTP